MAWTGRIAFDRVAVQSFRIRHVYLCAWRGVWLGSHVCDPMQLEDLFRYLFRNLFRNLLRNLLRNSLRKITKI